MSNELQARADAMLASHRPAEASRLYLMLLQLPHTGDATVDRWLGKLAECYRVLGRRQHLGYLEEFAEKYDRALETLSPAGAPPRQHGARGRLISHQARVAQPPTGPAALALHRDAARAYQEAGLLVQAAIALGRASDKTAEQRVWEQALGSPRLEGRLYERALLHYNLGCAYGPKASASARGHFIEAQRLLEEAADDCEQKGQLDRTFDCFAMLIQIGRENGSPENISEGFVNCIRILKRDNLKFFALQYYEDYLRLCRDHKEVYAAAALCREAADYCRRVNLAYANSYLGRAADLWLEAAKHNDQEGGPPELSENALLQGVDALSAIGDFQGVRRAYEALTQLRGQSEKRRARYRQIAERYPKTAAARPSLPPLPEYLTRPHSYPAIWHLDLVEWEVDGDPEPLAAMLVGDGRLPRETRQRALVALLLLRDAYEQGGSDQRLEALPATTLSEICQHLGEIRSYSMLSALERLFASGGPAVRFAVMKACGTLYFKRTFQLVERALVDPDASVQKAALTTIGQLHFRHAFDPLVRLYRNHTEQEVREAVLGALGKIASPEAAEFLIDIVRHEDKPLRKLALRLLEEFDPQAGVPQLRRHAELETGTVNKELVDLVRKLETRMR